MNSSERPGELPNPTNWRRRHNRAALEMRHYPVEKLMGDAKIAR